MTATINATEQYDAAIQLLEASQGYRVLRRFEPRTRYNDEPWNLGDRSRARVGVFVDCETTGLDTESDEIIELALVSFGYDAETGAVYDVHPPLSWLEEPRKPISPEIADLTGITPEMVKGKRIDDEAVEALLGAANLVIAHSARFDRKMVERRMRCFEAMPWACSQEDVDWKRFGVTGGALLNIAMSAAGVFTEGAHRAAHDCQLGIHVLATAMLDGTPAMAHLLKSARTPTQRVRALGSPRYASNVLKARSYRALYYGGAFQYWYKDVRSDAEASREMDWCRDEASADPDVQLIGATDRFSVRA